MSNKRISFSGVDNGVAAMMEKLRSKSSELAGDLIRDARQASKSSKDQVANIEDQIKAIERRNKIDAEGRKLVLKERMSSNMNSSDKNKADKAKASFKEQMDVISREAGQDDMQVKLLRDVIETIKITGKEEIRENRKAVERNLGIGGIYNKAYSAMRRGPKTDEGKLKEDYQRELLAEKKQGGAGSVFRGIMAAEITKQLINAINSLPNSKNEEQFIGNMLSGIPLFGPGISAAYNRSTEEALSAQMGRNKVSALTGKWQKDTNLTRFGLDLGEGNEFAEQVARSMGTGRGLSRNATNAMAFEKGFSLDRSTIMDQMSNTRFTKGSDFSREMVKTFKVAQREGLFKGGDITVFGEILRNQSTLVKDFSKTAEKVDGNVATRLLMDFNKVGGGFGARDPRSLERIMGISNDLSNPGNDFMKAQNLSVLRKLRPNAGLFDLESMEEKGIQTPGFLKGVLGEVSAMGGDEQMQMLALSRRLPSLSKDAVRQLYKNKGAIGSGQMSDSDIGKIMSDGTIGKIGDAATPALLRSQAEISKAFVDGAIPGMMEVATKVGGKIADMINSSIKHVGLDKNQTYKRK